MRLMVYCTLIFCFCTLTACTTSDSGKIPPVATKGVLDLTAWDFDKDGPVNLNGQWEFYWKQLLMPEDYTGFLPSQKVRYVNVPHLWNNHTTDNSPINGKGYATYRLKILHRTTDRLLALKFSYQHAAQQAYINEKLISSRGAAGKTAETTKPQFPPQFEVFSSKDNSFDIILQISNFHFKSGGIHKEIKLGNEHDLRSLREKNLSADLFLLGSILIMGLYHLTLFIIRREDHSSFYFSVVCFLVALRTITTNECYLAYLISADDWRIIAQVQYISYFLGIAGFIIFMHTLFNHEISKRVAWLCLFIGMFFTLAILIMPVEKYAVLGGVYDVFTLIVGTYGFCAIVLAVVRKREGATIFLIGFSFLFFIIVNDILHENSIITTGNFAPLGLFMFLFCQALLLSFRYAKTFITVKNQHLALAQTNIAFQQEIKERKRVEEKLTAHQDLLENLVKMRTSELHHANDILQQEVMERKKAEKALQKANRNLQDLASIDSLTKVQNRRLFDENLKKEWRRLHREQKPLSLIMCDVDFFKAFNDTYGHMEGDECLRSLAQTIKDNIRRSSDIVARYGGEEFAVILPGTDIEGASQIAETIRFNVEKLEIEHLKSSAHQYVTVSLGIACMIPNKASSPEGLVMTADKHLYEAKSNGRNRVACKVPGPADLKTSG